MTDAAATCPLCGAAVAIVGETTLHDEPTTTAAEVVEAQRQRIVELEAERDEAREGLWITCGHSHPNPDTERLTREMRRQEGYQTDGGCERRMKWMYAYRCVECGRFFHRDCIREHFAATGDASSTAEHERLATPRLTHADVADDLVEVPVADVGER